MALPFLAVAEPGPYLSIWVYRMPKRLCQQPRVIKSSPKLSVPLCGNRDEQRSRAAGDGHGSDIDHRLCEKAGEKA